MVASIVLLAGCLSPATSPVSPSVPEDVDRVLRTVVHGASGLVDPAGFPLDLPQMTQRYVANRGSGEPTIAVNARNVALFPSIEFDAAGGTLARTELYRSKDMGVTWQEVTPVIAGQDFPPQSLDPYVYADPTTGRLFSLDLYVGCSYLVYSDNDADTWTHQPIACGVPANDHQTLFAGPPIGVPMPVYPNVLYYCINQVAVAMCTHSLDGGLTWAPGQNPFLGVQAPSDGASGDPEDNVCGGLHGHGHASFADGTIYIPKGHCGKAWVSISRDMGVTWTPVLVDATAGFDGHDAIVSTDSKGNAYYFFLDRHHLPMLSISRDQGRTWSGLINVTVPGLVAAKFPTIVAGDEGRIAFQYVGSMSPGALARTVRGDPTASAAANASRQSATWNAYIGFAADALAEDPAFATTMVNDPADPLRRGDCAGRCNGMFDFFDITINPMTGQVWSSLVDLCNDKCAAADGTNKDPVISRGAVGIQTGGFLLRA